MERLKAEHSIKFKWIAFPLHPDTPEEGQTLEQLFAGMGKDIPAMLQRLEAAAANEGLAFGKRKMTFNSRRAQELGKWVEEQGKGDQFHLAMFEAYFVHGLNIADFPVLRDVVEKLGLDPDEAQRVVEEKTYAALVDAEWTYSMRMGVRSVPTFVAGGKGLTGYQSYQALQGLVQAVQSGGVVL
jgi:predicted DsbA family dithiol-disulfide isomerase